MSNKYTIQLSDPTATPIDVYDDTIMDSFSSIFGIGKGIEEYGEQINNNFFHILENFASPTPPTKPLIGQLWFNNDTQSLKAYDGTVWNTVGSLTVSDTLPTLPSQGDLWWDSTVVAPDSAEDGRNFHVYVNNYWTRMSDDYLPRDGHKVMTGNLEMDNFNVIGVQHPNPPISSNTPDNPSQGATTQYVHDRLADITGDTFSGTLTFDNVSKVLTNTTTNAYVELLQEVDSLDSITLVNAEYDSTYNRVNTSTPLMHFVDDGEYTIAHATAGTIGSVISWTDFTTLSGTNVTTKNINITSDVTAAGNITSAGSDILTVGNFETKQTEAVQDIVGSTLTGNTELGINVTYSDTTGKVNLDVDDFTITFTGDLTGSGVVTNLSNTNLDVQVVNDSHTHNISYYTKAQTLSKINIVIEELLWQYTLAEASLPSYSDGNPYFCQQSSGTYDSDGVFIFHGQASGMGRHVYRNLTNVYNWSRDSYSGNYYNSSSYWGPVATVTNYTSTDIKWVFRFQLWDGNNDAWRYRIVRDSTVIYTSGNKQQWRGWLGCYYGIYARTFPESSDSSGIIEDIGGTRYFTDTIPPGATYTYNLQGIQYYTGTVGGPDAVKFKAILNNYITQI